MIKMISTEAELELKEAKEAIQTLKEYCENRGNCENCDTDIQDWCVKYIVPRPDDWCPSNWKVGD